MTMARLEISAKVKKVAEKITRVGEDNGEVDAVCEITFTMSLSRRDYLRLARAELRGDDLLLALDVATFQMSLDDMWYTGSTQDGP